jgi:hypothetical protein
MVDTNSCLKGRTPRFSLDHKPGNDSDAISQGTIIRAGFKTALIQGYGIRFRKPRRYAGESGNQGRIRNLRASSFQLSYRTN